jgi:Phosphotransferase enzyme family
VSLVSPNVAAFETEARERAKNLIEAGLDGEALTELFGELAASSLPRVEVFRRAGRLAEILGVARGADTRLAQVAIEADPTVKAAILRALPADLLQRVYTDQGDVVLMGGQVLNDALVEIPSTDEGEDEEDDYAARVEDWNTVLLLGSQRETKANRSFLDGNELTGLRVASLAELEELAGEHHCGVVIHQGWWEQFENPTAKVAFVRGLIANSNLLYLKIDCRGLNGAETTLAQMVEGLDLEVQSRISTDQSSDLGKVDLARLQSVSRRLRNGGTVGVGVEGIDDDLRRLLSAAVAAFAERRKMMRIATDEELSIEPIAGGSSGAKVLAVRSAAFGAVLIVKVDELAKLESELARARIALPPALATKSDYALYSLSGDGVLVQPRFDDLDHPEKPAPSLRGLLQRCSAWEKGRAGVEEPSLEDLRTAVDRAIGVVKQVNREVDAEASDCWLTANALQKLAEHGVRWSIPGAEGDFDPEVHVAQVEETLAEHGKTHMIHGDLHPGNVLMFDERTPGLIDYALAGSGHPCFDFVRLSSGITYEFMRPLTPEPALTEFFTKVHLEDSPIEELEEDFEALIQGVGSQVSVHALVACRDAALEAINGDGNKKRRHYLAMTYLVAVQSLTLDSLQAATARSALAAIGPALT